MISLIFEDELYSRFYPLAYTRPVYELKCGAYAIADRIALSSGGGLRAACRPQLAKLASKLRPGLRVNDPSSIDDDVLLVNSRAVPTEASLSELARRGVLWTRGGQLVACLLKEAEARELWDLVASGRGGDLVLRLRGLGFEAREAEGVELLKGPWDLVRLSPELLGRDLASMPRRAGGVVEEGAVVKGELSNLIIEEGAVVEPLCLIDLRKGPVFIGSGSVVESGSRVEGPAYIGRGVLVRGAYVRSGCVIGDHCRLGGGGEVEASILHGYVNKYHLGFLGHSYVGEWVNVAAATTNSDLKNTYGTVRVAAPGGRVDTGMTKLGCFIGDHAKTSVGTAIYTGVKVGVCSHVHGFVVRGVPSFTIWAESLGRRPVELRLEDAIKIARRVKERRGAELSSEEEEVLRAVFKETEGERAEAGVVKGEFRL
ncbi:MAG: putative sugar nucleotidyl transferase [Candidatus Nezhaarchaeales archaeon]